MNIIAIGSGPIGVWTMSSRRLLSTLTVVPSGNLIVRGEILKRRNNLASWFGELGFRALPHSQAEIEYTCPIGLTGNRRNEVLSMGKELAARGRARTDWPIQIQRIYQIAL
ncbi:MAG: hypothetical protein ABSA45_08110 [Verrucomicrobiota bacterium]